MKKIVVLAMVLALAAVMPLLANTVTFGGDLTYGFTTDLDAAYAESIDSTLDAKVVVDDFNTVNLSWNIDGGAMTQVQGELVTDLAKALKLAGFGIVLHNGYFSSANNEYGSVSGYGNEDVAALSTATDWRYAVVYTIGPASILVSRVADPAQEDFLAGVYGAFGPANVELFYDVDTAEAFGDGALGIDGNVALPVAGLKVGVNFLYDMGASTYAWGLGLSGAVAGISFGVGLDGNDVNALNFATINAGYAFGNAGLDLGVALNLVSGAAEVLDDIDVSLYYKVGAVSPRLGYYYAPDVGGAAKSLNAPALAGGGVYFKVDINL